MDKPQSLRRFLFEAGVIAIFVLLLAGLFQAASRGGFLSPQSANESPSPQITDSETGPTPYPPMREVATFEPYPQPDSPIITARVPVTQEPDMFVSLLPLLGGNRVALMENETLWMAGGDHPTRAIADIKDIAVIFGWNPDRTKLLFGRGKYPTEGGLSDATELWLYNINIGEAHRLVDSQRIWSASVSPVDDRIAYCEYGAVVTILSLDGTVLQQRKDLRCDFAWSPDGSALAVQYSSPDMVLSDGLATTALAIWWLEKDELQLLSDARYESHGSPIWSIDGKRILFQRSFTELSEHGINGLYLADIAKGEISYLSNGLKLYIWRQSRSPGADVLVYQLGGDEIYIMPFDGEPQFIGNGVDPVWLPDGKTVVFRGQGKIETRDLDINVLEKSFGGGQISVHYKIHPDYFFTH